MNKPLIKKDSFWGDVLNALLLRPPYREQPMSYKFEPIPDPPVTIEDDPTMSPGTWHWWCTDPECTLQGTGQDQDMRRESMMHCLNTGHGVMGNVVEE